jgi:hypothetical protein
MAFGHMKTEMGKRNGKGRWMKRADAKHFANRVRRKQDRRAAEEA